MECFLPCLRSTTPISQPVLAAAPFSWPKVLAGRKHVPDFLSEFSTSAAATLSVHGTAGVRQPVAGDLYSLDREQRRNWLMQEVSSVVTNLLGSGKCGAGVTEQVFSVSSFYTVSRCMC